MRLGRPSALRHGRLVAIALAMIFAAGTGDASTASVAVGGMRIAHVVDRSNPRRLDSTVNGYAAPASWATLLPAVEVTNRNTNARATLKLYADNGEVDRTALDTFMRVASSSLDEISEPLDPRLIQLAFRAAYHFRATSLVVVSATRRGAHGKHGSGHALDFKLDSVPAAALAAYARSFPRAGVGIYTHPKTQYVHVDVRERSYHWLDGSPPGVSWRERLLKDPGQPARDASYVAAMDLPEPAAH